MVLFLAKPKRADLVVLQELLETGQVTPVIGRQCPLSEVPEALSYLGQGPMQGHTRGEVVIAV